MMVRDMWIVRIILHIMCVKTGVEKNTQVSMQKFLVASHINGTPFLLVTIIDTCQIDK